MLYDFVSISVRDFSCLMKGCQQNTGAVQSHSSKKKNPTVTHAKGNCCLKWDAALEQADAFQ